MKTNIGLKRILLFTLQYLKKTDTTQGKKGTNSFSILHAPSVQNPSLERFESFPHAQTFCGKPEPLYTTQYSDLFVIYTNDFNMHTGLNCNKNCTRIVRVVQKRLILFYIWYERAKCIKDSKKRQRSGII